MDGQNFNNEYDTYQESEPQQNGASGLSIASLVIAIIGALLGCCVPIIGMLSGVVALVLGIIGIKQNKTGLGIAAIVVSVISIVLGIVGWVINIILLANFDTIMQELESMSTY